MNTTTRLFFFFVLVLVLTLSPFVVFCFFLLLSFFPDRMMSDFNVEVENDNIQEFFVEFKGPKDSKCCHATSSLNSTRNTLSEELLKQARKEKRNDKTSFSVSSVYVF